MLVLRSPSPVWMTQVAVIERSDWVAGCCAAGPAFLGHAADGRDTVLVAIPSWWAVEEAARCSRI